MGPNAVKFVGWKGTGRRCSHCVLEISLMNQGVESIARVDRVIDYRM